MHVPAVKNGLDGLLHLVCLVATIGGCGLTSEGQEKPAAENEGRNERAGTLGFPNVPFPTLGGKQFWTDHRWKAGWRIQKNAVTGHWRLLDDGNVRRVWGSRSVCQQRMDEVDATAGQQAEFVYLLVHGLGRSSASMKKMQAALQKHEPEAIVVNFEYASTRQRIREHSGALQELVEHLPEQAKLRFVGHSLGNIVVRYALAEWETKEQTQLLDRVDRFVMLGPPNQGSSIAKRLSKLGVFQVLTGASGQELGADWSQFEKNLAIPHCPFGIVAGRLESQLGQNPLVEGEGDFVVSVEETKLAGAADFLEVPQLHSFLMDDVEVQSAVISFMDTEKF